MLSLAEEDEGKKCESGQNIPNVNTVGGVINDNYEIMHGVIVANKGYRHNNEGMGSFQPSEQSKKEATELFLKEKKLRNSSPRYDSVSYLNEMHLTGIFAETSCIDNKEEKGSSQPPVQSKKEISELPFKKRKLNYSCSGHESVPFQNEMMQTTFVSETSCFDSDKEKDFSLASLLSIQSQEEAPEPALKKKKLINSPPRPNSVGEEKPVIFPKYVSPSEGQLALNMAMGYLVIAHLNHMSAENAKAASTEIIDVVTKYGSETKDFRQNSV